MLELLYVRIIVTCNVTSINYSVVLHIATYVTCNIFNGARE